MTRDSPSPVERIFDTLAQEWEHGDLLTHGTFLHHKLTLHEMRTSPLVIVHNGRAKDGRGGYDWIISTISGVRLVEGYGPAYGESETMSSFRAEVYGRVEALCWLTDTLVWFYLDQESTPTQVYCDNQGLITWGQTHKRQLAVGPSLETDSDVTIPWQAMLDRRPLITLHHVRGHQDEKMGPSHWPKHSIY